MKIKLLFFLCFALTGAAFAQPLSGDYTIDSALPTGGANFQSFSDFAASLNANGVSGHVTATVEPGSGPYQEQVVFSNIAGTGPNATVTLEGSGETISAVTTTTNRHVVRLANCQYFTVNNLRVVWDPASTGGFYAIHIFGTGNHITVSNCEVDMLSTTSTLYGAYIASGSETSILTTGDFHNLLFTGNSSQGGGYGVSVFGLVSPLASNIEISNNQLINAHSNAIYIRETDGVNIHHNFIDKTTSNVTGWNAIQIAQAANINANIHNNYIQVSQTANGTMTFRGIYLFNGAGHKVYNNIITNINLQSGNVKGIEVRTGGTAPQIYFNTISIDNPENTTGNLYGISEELSNTNAVLRNNLISITQPGTGLKSGLVIGSTANPMTAFNSDYNIIHVPGGNVAQRGTLSPTFYPTLANWQSVSGQDANSYSDDPVLESLILPKPTNLALNDKGIAFGGLTIDYFGIGRGTPPDIGAIEFGSCPPPPAPQILGGPVNLCENTQGVDFSVSPDPDVLQYNWSVPPGSTIVSGQGTPDITVNFGATSGFISVTAQDTCGVGPAAIIQVVLNPPPPMPGPISGSANICLNEGPFTYSIPPVIGASAYNWTLPPGAEIIQGGNGPIIIVQFGSESSGVISVSAENDCGAGGASTLNLTVYPPTQVTLDIPQDTVCTTDAPFALSGGDPVDGVYSGPGVSGGMFDPSEAGVGAHVITLSYLDEFGCTFSAEDVVVVEICSSVSEPAAAAWTLFPNPTDGMLYVKDLPASATRLRVYDRLGRLVLEKTALIESGIDLSGLPPGVYIVEVGAARKAVVKF